MSQNFRADPALPNNWREDAEQEKDEAKEERRLAGRVARVRRRRRWSRGERWGRLRMRKKRGSTSRGRSKSTRRICVGGDDDGLDEEAEVVITFILAISITVIVITSIIAIACAVSTGIAQDIELVVCFGAPSRTTLLITCGSYILGHRDPASEKGGAAEDDGAAYRLCACEFM